MSKKSDGRLCRIGGGDPEEVTCLPLLLLPPLRAALEERGDCTGSKEE